MTRLSLSVCLMTTDPPARLSSILEPLRPFAEEIVIAADSRLGDETLDAYGQIADRLYTIDFRFVERHLGWLYAQCRCDWILRLDGDEVPSQAFLRRLPELLASRSAQQFWVPSAWLFADAGCYLAGTPWSHGFMNRLTRNDATLRVSGLVHEHAETVSPREYIEEPFYHVVLLTSDEQGRRDKAVRYEVARPGLLAPGGGRLNEAFYLPELRERLELREVPAEDRALLKRVLAPAPRGDEPTQPPRERSSAVAVTLAESDRYWEPRAVKESAYRARITPLDERQRLTAGERMWVFVRVSNDGDERWPASLDAGPHIRLGHRWLTPEGSVAVADGPRTAFPRVVGPGEMVLAPVDVDVPAAPGHYLLEVDVVHEHVRWFGCACRIPVEVVRQTELPAPGGRVRASPRRRASRLRRLRIPRVIHRAWLGERPMGEREQRFGETLARHHPGWEMRLWTDDDLAALDIGPGERARARSASELSNVVRYEVLRRLGGVYFDTDFECLRDLTPLLRGVKAFAALEDPGRVATGALGCVPGHPAFARAAMLARQTLGTGVNSADANGPLLMTLILEQEPGVTVLGAEHFYPYRWDEPERRGQHFPDAYAVHHWAASWREEEEGA
jgi:hypothetical protein